MLEGGLANLGFLGGSFQWWIGQICDDSTWRDNILPYKFEEAEQIPGWGYRYKVRILGIHPMSTDILPSEKLKFATVMYGVTDGGGQGGTFATPAIRPGNFVFGFFLDGNQEEVPIIMGILGNNAQTELQGKTELTGGKAGKGISGYAEQKDKSEETKITAGDNLSISKPKSKLATQESGLLNKLNSGVRSLKDLNVGDNISQITDDQERGEIESMIAYERGLG